MGNGGNVVKDDRSDLKFSDEESLASSFLKVRILAALAFLPALLLSLLDLTTDFISFSDSEVLGLGLAFSAFFFLISLLGLLLLTSKRVRQFQIGLYERLRDQFAFHSTIFNVASVFTFVVFVFACGLFLLNGIPSKWLSYALVVVWWLYIGIFAFSSFLRKEMLQNLPATYSVLFLLVLYSGFMFSSAANGLSAEIRAQFRLPDVAQAGDFVEPGLTPVDEPIGTVIEEIVSAPANPLPEMTTQQALETWRDNANILAVQSMAPTTSEINVAEYEDAEFLQSILDEIFPDGMEGLSEEDVAVDVTKYISMTFDYKNNLGNATKILKDGYAFCSGMSISHQALMQQAGIPARYISLFGLPTQGGHNLVEVYYDGDWHLFDPTFGLFFYSSPDFDQSGQIPSLHELAGTSIQDWYLFKVVDTPWNSVYDRNTPVELVNNDYLYDFFSHDFISEYKAYFSGGFPVSYGYDRILSFPVEIDLNNSARGTETFIGTIDQSIGDLINLTAAFDSAGKVGNYYLGGNLPDMVDTLTITTDTPGYVNLIYHSVDESMPELALFPLKGVYVVEAKQEGTTAEFLLRTSSTEAILQVYSRTGDIFWIDAIEAEWLGEELPTN
jgi:hypothetical protein